MTDKEFEGQQIETDVTVVGYGGAGATAAISAHDNGAEVIVLEKMPAGGGNTKVSAGVIMNPGGTSSTRYIETLCAGTTESEIIKTFVENAIKNNDWLKEIGGETEPRQPGIDILYPSVPLPCWPGIPNGEKISRYTVKRKEGAGLEMGFGEPLWQLLSKSVEHRKIRVMTSTRARQLLTNKKGEVIGVVAERENQNILLKARRAVILTCGGFEHNEEMKLTYLPTKPFYAFGCLGNTGDGIEMATKVGAALWHMTAVASPLGFKTPEYQAAFYIRIYGGRFIYVDIDGNRFTNEAGLEMHEMRRVVSHFDIERFCYPRMPTYAIFDDVTRRRGPINTQALGVNRAYDWSLDNSREIAKGWIKKGQNIRALAKEISVDGSALEKSISRYNEFCQSGVDSEFNRAKESLEPIDKAPYYAIKLWPCLLNTQGGPRRDEQARVLDHDTKPIPRLYSAGELGSLWGFIYEAAGNLAECLVFGRIAGKNAAIEKPWS
jgi:succinate dehydrogenase/fumarate reductase flavoprotein subunit